MTLTEFKNAHIFPVNNPVLDKQDRPLNLLYNTYAGGVSRLEAIAVRINSNNLNQLQQATSITCKVGENGNYITVRLDDTLVPVEVTKLENYYIYAITPNAIDETKRPVITPSPTGDTTYLTELLIEPMITIDALSKDTYTALYNSDAVDRQSIFIQQSDRAASTVNPVNIQSIQTRTALPASIQDSLYSDTGWSNGRYLGTKTTADGYGGIDPTIAGISFTGAYYPLSVADSTISTATIDTRVIQEYFLIPGQGVDTSVPVVTYPADSTKTAVYKATGQLTATRTVFDFTVISGAVEKEPIKVGDYLYLYNVNEIVKVEQVVISGGTSTTTVKRYMFGTNPSKTTSVVETTTRVLTDINRVYQVESNRIEFLGEGKVWIQTSGDILRMDELGYSATGSIAT